MILETERLFLRTLTANDYAGLCDILQDEKVMYAYEHAFSDEEVLHWLNRQLQRYRENGFGLWAVVLKHSGKLIGQAGITLQPWRNRQVHEIGICSIDATGIMDMLPKRPLDAGIMPFANLG